VGDFVETALPEWRVKPGDWVTVTVKAADKRPIAVRVDVWRPSEG
jgi:FtsP/CotA-like multicopper oxidase with cupredoxin domain